MKSTPTDRLLRLARKTGAFRPRDLDQHGIAREYLRLAQERGLLRRVGWGLYVAADADLTEHHSFAEVAKRVPRGVVCLLSALRFHELTSQAPFEVWLAIGESAWAPRIETPRVRLVRFSRTALEFGQETHKIEGVPVKVFTPAKTVADCFRYRNKIGTDVAIEALRDCVRSRKATTDELWQAAKVCRVANVMRPYLEATV